MSGIFGLCYWDGREARPDLLLRMDQLLAHRGPDGSGQWCRHGVGLGHRLFRTTPESLHESLPQVSASGNVVLTADARIDNRSELISDLELHDPGGTISDGTLILAAHQKWGADAPCHLIGDFAYALWDLRTRQLFCARDPFGVKPFYYFHREGRAFFFASELKALLALPEVSRDLTDQVIADHLVWMERDTALTPYVGLFRLPPAHVMTVTAEGMQLRRYWSLDAAREIRFPSDGDYEEAFREQFTEAVRCRLRSLTPVASTLSGGLDSSSVTVVARQLQRTRNDAPLPVFSFIFDESKECDERGYIQDVVAQGGTHLHPVLADQIPPLSAWAPMSQYQDTLRFFPNFSIQHALYCAVAQAGCRVLLTGSDGDIVVSHAFYLLNELLCTAKIGPFFHELACEARQTGTPVYTSTRLLRDCIKSLLPTSVRIAGAIMRGSYQTPWKSRLICPDFAKRVGLTDRLNHLWNPNRRPIRTVREEHLRDLSFGGIATMHEEEDSQCVAAGIETRHPFFDRRLVEFCLSLPALQKRRNGYGRSIMRRSLRGLLPQTVANRRSKAEFSRYARNGLLHRDREQVEQILQKPDRIAPYVHLPSLRAAWDRYQSSPIHDLPTIIAGNNLWQAIILDRWLARHF
jgi:asparagine synthase (glutamine-hydrolysing)